MTRSADIAKAREVDTKIAAAWDLYWDAMLPMSRMESSLKEAKKMVRYYTNRSVNSGMALHYQNKVDHLEARIAETIEEAKPLAEAARQMDKDLYEGWSRFFKVQHIHSNQRCSSFRPTTRIVWLPSVSGLTEAEAVKEHGATLCTICFPSAPVELTTAAVDETVCPGSGTYVKRDLPNRLGYYSGNWATCPDCGERVTVAGQNGVKLRKHKK